MSQHPQFDAFPRKLGPTLLMLLITAGGTIFFAVGLWANRWDVAGGGGVTKLADSIAPLLTIVGTLTTVALAVVLLGGHVRLEEDRLYWPISGLPWRRSIPWSVVSTWTRGPNDIFVLRMTNGTQRTLRAGDLKDVNGFSEGLERHLGPPQP